MLDGQLWRTLDVSPYQEISHDALLRLARAAGPFVKKLNLRGMANLPSSMLVGLTAAHSGSGISEHVENGHGTGAIGAIGAMTRLTHLDLEGCRSISNKALHHLLSRSPALRSVNLRDLRCVNNETCALLARSAFKLEAVDVSRCVHMDANGLLALTGASTVTDDADEAGKQAPTYPYRTPLKVLRASGIRGTSPEMMATLGRKVPHLEVLDMSYSPDLTDDALAAFIASPGPDDPECGPYISLSSRQAGLDPSSDTTYHRRLTTLVHLNLSACRHLTDRSCAHFAHAVPQLEVLELANIGPALRDAGLVKLFATTPEIRKVDLEEASELTEATFAALTPPEAYVEAYVQLPAPDAPSPSHSLSRRFRRAASPTPTIALRAATGSAKAKPLPPVAGLQLTHLIVSHVTRVDERTMLSLLRACPHLRIFEADDTHAGDKIAREFVRLARFRELRNASLSLVDCRGLARNIATSLAAEKVTRPRNGVRGYAFAQFDYDDPDEELGSHASHAHAERAGTAATLDECDDARVALKSFWGWQTVDARAKAKAKAAKKARGARRHFTNGLSGGAGGSTTTASANGGSGGGASTGAGLGNGRNWIERGATHGRATPHRSARWGRALAGGLLSPLDDDDDDPRGCVIA